jgi:hypothetical protein
MDLRVMLTTTTFVASTARVGLLVWTVPSPSSLTLGCLPSSLYTFLEFLLGLARDYHANDFPEFDR